MSDRAVVHARLDAGGNLIEAEAALDALNTRAGGAIGRPLAVVELAAIGRLASRLGVRVSRGITVADGDGDLELWVRAEPSAAGIALQLDGWQERAAWRPPALGGDDDAADTAAGWRWEIDASLRLTMVSLAAGQRLGFDAPQLLGAPLTQLFRLEEDGDGALPLLEAVAGRTSFARQRATVRGTDQVVELSASPRSNASGAFAGYAGIAAEVAPGTAAASLTDAFTARLGRALRVPLARIIANADSINAASDGPLEQNYVDYAADIATAGRHLLSLIDDLADLQTIEGADFTVEIETIDLADVARRAAGLLSVRAADRAVAIERPEPFDRLMGRGDFRRALQVLVNVIGNAIRYSPGNGAVVVRAAAEGDRAVVSVTDQGKGIAAADQTRIFEKFERVDPGEPGGSGLGLYIARRLARAMGGDLSVESTPGAGATFTLSLPLAS